MSAYLVHKLCRRVLHDLEFRALIRARPEAALDQFPFTPEERRALLAGDVGWLHQQGASAFLLLILSRFEVFGLELPVFNARMRALLQKNKHASGGHHDFDNHGGGGRK